MRKNAGAISANSIAAVPAFARLLKIESTLRMNASPLPNRWPQNSPFWRVVSVLTRSSLRGKADTCRIVNEALRYCVTFH
jgi:hypothetical protein